MALSFLRLASVCFALQQVEAPSPPPAAARGLLGALESSLELGKERPDAGKPPRASRAGQAADAGSVDAGGPEAGEVAALVARMQRFYEQTNDFSAGFEQTYTYAGFNRTQTSAGTVQYKKPAMMRWEYKTPTPRTFVLAKEKAFMHDPEAMLLTVSALSTSQLSASVTFLWGQGKLDEEFAITRKACDACQGVLLELKPLKPDPRFQRVLLEVEPRTAQVLVSTVVDPDGSKNVIRFLELKRNVGLETSAFQLRPPRGTQVQDLTASPPTAPSP